MEKILLTNEEITNLKKLQEELSDISYQLGEIEIQFEYLKDLKSQVLNKLSSVKQAQQTFGVELNKKYGNGVVDLTSSEFTKSN